MLELPLLRSPLAPKSGTLQRSSNWQRLALTLLCLGRPVTARGGTLRRIPGWECLVLELLLLWSPLAPKNGTLQRSSNWQRLVEATLASVAPCDGQRRHFRRSLNWKHHAPELPLPQSHLAARGGTLRSSELVIPCAGPTPALVASGGQKRYSPT